MVDRVLKRSPVSAVAGGFFFFFLLTGLMVAICQGDRRKTEEADTDIETRTLLAMLISTYVRRLDAVCSERL